MEEKQKTRESCLQKDKSETEGYAGVQTVIGMVENELVEVQLTPTRMLEYILTPDNLNRAYRQVRANQGSCGSDRMEVEELLPYLREHKEELVSKLERGRYKPRPVRRVEIPKENGKTRLLGIPTVVDRFVQQAVAQVLTIVYEPLFSDDSFGFRHGRGAHDALRRVLNVDTLMTGIYIALLQRSRVPFRQEIAFPQRLY